MPKFNPFKLFFYFIYFLFMSSSLVFKIDIERNTHTDLSFLVIDSSVDFVIGKVLGKFF
jgi:hypothetical protein